VVGGRGGRLGGVEVAVGLDCVEAVEGGVEGWVFEELVLLGEGHFSWCFCAPESSLSLQRGWGL